MPYGPKEVRAAKAGVSGEASGQRRQAGGSRRKVVRREDRFLRNDLLIEAAKEEEPVFGYWPADGEAAKLVIEARWIVEPLKTLLEVRHGV